MLTLCLFRHAKSSWDDPARDDFDRPLNARGRKAAPMMGRYIVREGLLPGRILCSPAVRTRETVSLAFTGLRDGPKVEIVDGLYLAPPERILDLVRKLPAKDSHVMIVGHNPGLHDLALDLLAPGQGEAAARLVAKLPTAAFVVLSFDVATWTDVAPRTGQLDRFVTPRDLETPRE